MDKLTVQSSLRRKLMNQSMLCFSDQHGLAQICCTVLLEVDGVLAGPSLGQL